MYIKGHQFLDFELNFEGWNWTTEINGGGNVTILKTAFCMLRLRESTQLKKVDCRCGMA